MGRESEITAGRCGDKTGARGPTPIARLPDGIIHHYAPLAVIGIAGNTVSGRSGCRMALQAPLKKEA
jgi:hypothetical protein